MRRTVRAAALGACALLLAGCGLPLPSGVLAPGPVAEEQPRARQISVIPPGPAEGATPRDLVEGFLGAQSSPEGRHAIARSFLTPEADRTWQDSGEVLVYDASSPLVFEQTSPETITVSARAAAALAPDGTYRRLGGELTDTYRVRCAARRCRIAALQNGLRLNPSDLLRQFAPRAVHFVAPSFGAATASGHLVADLVWLPRVDEAAGLVRAVLRGPSSALEDSVGTAVPAGTSLARPVTASPDGTVTVDLTSQAGALDDARREQLSAQLVWTLRALDTGFSRLRLLVDGRPLSVGGSDAPQSARAWPAYDPDRLRPKAPALYLEQRRLRSLVDGGLATSDATEGRLPVDGAAASPDGFLALLTDRPDGGADLRTGPQAGPFGEPRVSGRLSSPTWGSGEQGLFVLRDGEVLLLPPEGGVVPVPVEGTSRPVRRIQVARDGVRVALLVGDADRPDLLVGRLRQDGTGPRVVGLREIVPTLRAVVDVSWQTGTSLLVLADFQPGRLPARVAVDGFTANPLLVTRLKQGVTPVSLTAADGRPVVLSGTVDGLERIYRDNGSGLFAEEARGRAPFYPG